MQNNKQVILSIVPTTKCNNGCNYCYLGPLRNIDDFMNISQVESAVAELKDNGYSISSVQIFGGDLDSDYSKAKSVDFFDNVYEVTQAREMSINGKCGNIISINQERKDYKENLEFLSKHWGFDVISIVLPKTYKKGPKDLLKTLNKNKSWRGVLTVYQYFPAAMADVNYEMTNKQYCDFMIGLLDEYLNGSYEFELSIIDELERNRVGRRESIFGACLYLLPGGYYADVRYDKDGLEYFETYRTIKEWEAAVKKQEMNICNECKICEYNKKCMAEHYREWKKGDVCCGMIPLIEWWEENRGRLNS